MQFWQMYAFKKFTFEKHFAVLFCEFSSDQPQPPENESHLEAETYKPVTGRTKTQLSASKSIQSFA